MTREQAINILYGIQADNLNFDNLYTKDKYEAIDMAIKALEQEPTTKNNLGVDSIGRAELLKAMDTWDKFGYLANHGLIRLGKENKYYVQYVRYEDMVKAVKDMPSVTPQEPNTGYWIDKNKNTAVCSCCNRNNTWYGNFCKWCGAKMVEPQESEDKE